MKVIDTLHILAIGRNPAIMAVVERLLNSHEHWKGLSVTSNAAALSAIEQTPYNIVLLCAGIPAAEEDTLRQALLQRQPQVIIAQHYGGGSGLLESEVRGLLAAHNISLSL
ncbi:hypothetical protein GA0116948_10956 [Chitinophaga costaii]|uniref:Response regulatory domain-containing protein n=1 Tax=Chitinophaga costaii TaxID=1335309 RepID=A0A1C4END2_9BACT|nr:hypothetical protein [Chitinophaga costaii]PUZ22460.1 hypothetical protein DCM91_14420 [Chitinophaga costaii]SCC45050.1 hypothetical protein GA0116948_10956 [Chitinophaga costaii]